MGRVTPRIRETHSIPKDGREKEDRDRDKGKEGATCKENGEE